jgi:hypothetical protein
MALHPRRKLRAIAHQIQSPICFAPTASKVEKEPEPGRSIKQHDRFDAKGIACRLHVKNDATLWRKMAGFEEIGRGRLRFRGVDPLPCWQPGRNPPHRKKSNEPFRRSIQ